ncbi:hypothetical protein X975_23192, partial [Stegodyphus mimosarum]
MRVPEAKVVILGAQGVGKTSFIHRYVGQIFQQHTSPTIGASFFTCNINVDSHEIKLLIWDTAGQERFRSMAPMYYRRANAAILMYDITCYDSYESMKSWVVELRVRLEEPIIMCVVGNKCDMNAYRQVGLREANEYAISIGALYHETSALSSEGVEGVFLDIAQELIRQHSIAQKESDTDPLFQEGRIIRVTSGRHGRAEESDDEKSFLCC